MKGDTVTILDVAKRAGVAPGTVSRVIHNTGYIKDATRTKIEKALNELNYVPNRAGRTLKTTRTGLIMLAIPDTSNAIYVGMIEAVQEYVDNFGYSMVLFYTGGKVKGELKAVRMLREHLVDGLFLIHFSYSAELRAAIDGCNSPVVLCGMCNNLWANAKGRRFSTISIDVFHGIYTATAGMIRAGHRKIAYLAGEKGTNVYLQRFQAYRKALRDHGIPYDGRLVFWHNYMKNHGREAASAVLAMKKRPTAMVASNDLQALGFWEECRDHGLAIPGNMALSGMDNLDEMNMLHLTSIIMMEDRIGASGAEILMRQLREKNAPPVDLSFRPELVPRASTNGAYFS
ncbi:MAG: LacI family transcriptional regulator [Planctomycetota bacterium]|jgi:DNA-binding LacI/PurR family transcriptional regulator|nr:LacI family transcriptional regulator [Planctomycetota bacterium]